MHGDVAMKAAICVIGLVSVLCVACSSVSQVLRLQAFDETASRYAKAVRWSDFDSASYFLQHTDGDEKLALTKKLKRIKVTTYTVKKVKVGAKKDTVSQVVEINYYTLTNPIVKSTMDHQRWEYDDDEDRWYLVSGLPQFK